MQKSADFKARITKLYESQYRKPEYAPHWYRKYIKPFAPDREEVTTELLQSGGSSILDIGCGEANVLIALAHKFDRLVGVDLIKYRIEKAKKKVMKKNIDNIELEVANIEDGLKYKKNSFQTVTCLGVLEYTFDPDFTIAEIARILKPGGTLILEVPNSAFIVERIRLLFGGLINSAPAPGWQGGRLHNFTSSTLVQLLEHHNFVVNKISGAGFLHTLRNFRPSLLSGDLILTATLRQ